MEFPDRSSIEAVWHMHTGGHVGRSRSRSAITLYSLKGSPRCQQVRLVLVMKDVEAHIIERQPDEPPHDDLLALNPFGTLPTLVDRDLTLFDADIISEYLDERYPFPPLWPTDPAARARARLILRCWVGNWYELYQASLGSGKAATEAAKQLNDDMLAHADGFTVGKWFMHEEPTMVDCALLPLLANLRGLDRLPAHPAIRRYCERHLASGMIARCLRE